MFVIWLYLALTHTTASGRTVVRDHNRMDEEKRSRSNASTGPVASQAAFGNNKHGATQAYNHLYNMFKMAETEPTLDMYEWQQVLKMIDGDKQGASAADIFNGLCFCDNHVMTRLLKISKGVNWGLLGDDTKDPATGEELGMFACNIPTMDETIKKAGISPELNTYVRSYGGMDKDLDHGEEWNQLFFDLDQDHDHEITPAETWGQLQALGLCPKLQSEIENDTNQKQGVDSLDAKHETYTNYYASRHNK